MLSLNRKFRMLFISWGASALFAIEGFPIPLVVLCKHIRSDIQMFCSVLPTAQFSTTHLSQASQNSQILFRFITSVYCSELERIRFHVRPVFFFQARDVFIKNFQIIGILQILSTKSFSFMKRTHHWPVTFMPLNVLSLGLSDILCSKNGAILVRIY